MIKSKVCDLLLALCDALLLAPDFKRILDEEAPAAFALAESLGDSSRAVRACAVGVTCHIFHRPVSWTDPQFVEWAERADRYAKPDTVERAYADWALGSIKSPQATCGRDTCS